MGNSYNFNISELGAMTKKSKEGTPASIESESANNYYSRGFNPSRFNNTCHTI